MSIATERGDRGQTTLAGGVRVSKADLRVEACGTIDELIASLGFARAICKNHEVCDRTKAIQRELFLVASAIRKPQPEVTNEIINRLTEEVHRIEAMEGIVADWSLPGEDAASAGYEVARTVCRRAERLAVRLNDEGGGVQPNVLRYLNRLSDLLWLFGRLIEVEQGIDSRLRRGVNDGPRWSRAW